MRSRQRWRWLVGLVLTLSVILTGMPAWAQPGPVKVGTAAPARAETPPAVGVVLDGQPLQMEVPPVVVDGRTLVPLRAIMEALGADLKWVAATATAEVSLGGHTVSLRVGDQVARVDGRSVNLDVPVQVVNGRMLVPLRFLVEATGGEVDWDAGQNAVILAVHNQDLKEQLRVRKANRELPDTEPKYTRKGREAGLELFQPTRGQLAVAGTLRLQGRVGEALEGDVVVVRVRPPRGSSRETTLAVRGGLFAGDIHLGDGTGEYSVSLWVPEEPGSSWIYEAVSLKVRNLSERPRQGAYYSRSYHQSGLRIDLPTDGQIAVDTALPLSGRAPARLNGRYLWIQLEKDGKEWDTYLPIREGRFDGSVHLGGGPGLYWATIYLQQEPGSQWYDGVAEVPVINTNPKAVPRSLAFLPPGLEAGLEFDSFATEVADGVLRVSGAIDPAYDGKTLWVVARHGDNTDDNIHLLIEDGRFAGEIPLTLGSGAYKVTVRVPERGSYYYDAAVLQVQNQATDVVRGIRYTAEAASRRIELTEPQSGRIAAPDRLTVAGTYGSEPGEYPYLIAIARKDDLEAHYRLPVTGGRFTGDVWLRFGPGEYEISLYAPETGTRSIEVARFTAENTGTADLRDTAPSFGIESDAPEVIALAEELTAGKTAEEAARAVFDWVAREVRYDYQKAASWRVDPDEGALRTLSTRTGVCRDYAALTVALLRAGGLEAHVVTGKAGSGFRVVGHAWVEVRLGERWVEMDPTFGAGVVDGTDFIPRYDPRYFDPPAGLLAETHTREGIQY